MTTPVKQTNRNSDKPVNMQTILGSGGAIGVPLARELAAYTSHIRLVSRHPKTVNPSDELIPADLTDPVQVDRAVEGSAVVYLTAGLEYKSSVWQSKWPLIMRNTIESCKKHGAALVFFDNVYMYDRDFMDRLSEDTPVKPSSRKGRVRAEIAGMLMDEIGKGRLKALIARSADFYGTKNSILVEMVVKNLDKGKKAMWFADAGKLHTFTSAEDAARATALLGNTPDAFNQVWHLPTSPEALTGEQWINLVARLMNKPARYTVVSKWMISALGLFVPIFREFAEMAYQYDRDYIFNSAKFEMRFGYTPQKPEEGIARLLTAVGIQ